VFRMFKHMRCDIHCMHSDIHCNAYLSHRPCSYGERSCFRFFDATDLAALWGETLLTTTCLMARFATVQGPQKDLLFRALSLHSAMNPLHLISVYVYVQSPSQLLVLSPTPANHNTTTHSQTRVRTIKSQNNQYTTVSPGPQSMNSVDDLRSGWRAKFCWVMGLLRLDTTPHVIAHHGRLLLEH